MVLPAPRSISLQKNQKIKRIKPTHKREHQERKGMVLMAFEFLVATVPESHVLGAAVR